MPSGNDNYKPQRATKSKVTLPENLDLSSSSHLPGLREAHIASQIVDLANQLPSDNPHREEIRDAAFKLYAHTGEQISNHGRGQGKSSAKK
ncbi:MAG TPA: hypothetical protein VIM69_05850 [Opitutaceae bacterium]